MTCTVPIQPCSIFRENRGFTLIELVLLIFLLTILGAVAVVQIGSVGNDTHDAAVDGVFTALQTQLAAAVGECRAYPSEADGSGTCSAAASDFSGAFQDAVTSRVAAQLVGSVAMSSYIAGIDNNATNGAIRICAGGTSGRSAVATYTLASGVGTLSLGAKGAGMSPCTP